MREQTTGRYQSLDLLRGMAILGTLATNIWIFSNPEGLVGYIADSTDATTPAVWRGVEAVLQQLAQGKFLGLLTLMFGIGLEIQRRSAVRAGRRWPGRYPWRAALLLLDGVLHFLLVVEFDVLMGYAVTGIVVAYLLATSERAQRRWLVTMASLHVVLLTLVTVGIALTPIGPSAPLQPNPYADGTWGELVRFRIENVVLFRLEPVFITALSIAMFLAGARLVRAGVLDQTGGPLRLRLIRIGAVALGADLMIGLIGGPAGVVFARYGTAPLVAIGLLALVTELVLRRPGHGWLRRRLSDVGRMALSCYVLQNLVASALCYGWGVGLADRLSPEVRVPATVGVYLVVVAIVLAAAAGWLRRFDRGPVELAWRWCFTAIDKAIPARSEPAIPPVRSPKVSR